MQGNGWQVQAQQPKVLDDERIHADAVQLMNESFNLHQLIVIDECVDRRIDAASKLVSVIAGPAHVIQRVARIGTRAMMRRTHVHRISAMVDGGNGNVGVTCGRQQLYEGRLLHKAVLQGCRVAVLPCCRVVKWTAALPRYLDVQGKRVGIPPGREFLPELRQLGRGEVGSDDGTGHALGNHLALEIDDQR